MIANKNTHNILTMSEQREAYNDPYVVLDVMTDNARVKQVTHWIDDLRRVNPDDPQVAQTVQYIETLCNQQRKDNDAFLASARLTVYMLCHEIAPVVARFFDKEECVKAMDLCLAAALKLGDKVSENFYMLYGEPERSDYIGLPLCKQIMDSDFQEERVKEMILFEYRRHAHGKMQYEIRIPSKYDMDGYSILVHKEDKAVELSDGIKTFMKENSLPLEPRTLVHPLCAQSDGCIVAYFEEGDYNHQRLECIMIHLRSDAESAKERHYNGREHEFDGYNITYAHFNRACHAIDRAQTALMYARGNSTQHEICELEHSLEKCTEDAELDFKQLNVAIYAILAHNNVVICTLYKNIADRFMVKLNASMCCDNAKLRFGIQLQAIGAKDARIKTKHIFDVQNYYAQFETLVAFTNVVKSIVVCDCNPPYNGMLGALQEELWN